MGFWAVECFGCSANEPLSVSAALAPDLEAVDFTFEFDFTGFLGNTCSGFALAENVPLNGSSFFGSGFLGTAEVTFAGAFDGSGGLAGEITFNNGPGCIVSAEGSYSASL